MKAASPPSRLETIKAEIKAADAQALAGVWQIGKLLTEARALVPHGEWALWITREFGWSVSYGARLMRLHSEYQDGLPAGLGISTLLALLPLEEQIREQLARAIQTADLSRAEAEQLISKAKAQPAEAEKVIARAADPAQVDKLRAELRAEIEASVKSDTAEIENLNKTLQTQLTDVRTVNRNLEILAAQSSTAQDQLAGANKQLKIARDELAEVRDKLTDLQAKPAEVKIVPPADYDKLKAEAVRLEKLNSTLAGEVDTARDRASELEDQLAAARASAVTLSPAESVKQIEAQLAAALARVAELETLILQVSASCLNTKTHGLHIPHGTTALLELRNVAYNIEQRDSATAAVRAA